MSAERHVTKSRWSRLSPLLDELLDLAPPERVARLAALRAGPEADIAEDLAELLRRQEAMEAAGYLAEPALPQAQLAAGQTVGSAYTLVRELGQGGMGTVWLARRTDGRFEGLVAIKFLTAGLLGRGDSGRFAREGQILARLAHPHIARLIDAGVAAEGTQPYLVLEYVDGLPITRHCAERALGVAERITLFLDVLAAVAHAHNRLILHRDLKPSNILVNASGEVKLLDFGIAKLLGDDTEAGGAATELTRQAGRVFTPQYAAPEQLQGGDVTTATDVYALGVLLYLLLSGQHPTQDPATQGSAPLEQMNAVIQTEPRRLSELLRKRGEPKRARELRGDLDTIVARALKKIPAERYANAAALAEDLRRWQAHEPIAARPDSALYQLTKFVRRHRTAVAAGSAAVLALSALTAFSFVQAWRAEAAEKIAQQRSAESDDLLGYLLGEFADKLRPIGRLELLDSVGGKALEHLAAEDGRAASPQARLQRAKALTVLGEVRVGKRELDKAIEPLLAAGKLLEGDPPEAALSGAWRKAQGTAAFWLGHVYFSQRQFAPAQLAWGDYLATSEKWLALAPGEVEPIVEVSYAHTNLGTLKLGIGELPEAAKRFQSSIELKRQALRLKPADVNLQIELGNSMSWLGTALLWQGEFEAARAVFAAGKALVIEARQSNRKDWEWLNREAVMQTWLAEALQGLGRDREARAELDGAARLMREILLQDPGNTRWALWSIRVETALAQFDRDPQTRIARLRELSERLSALNKNSSVAAYTARMPTRTQLFLALARSLADQGQPAQAKALLTPFLAEVGNVQGKQLEDARLRQSLVRAQLALADVEAVQTARQELCRLAMHKLDEVPSLRRVHFEITQAWVDAKTCLGQGSETAAERAWLASKTASRD